MEVKNEPKNEPKPEKPRFGGGRTQPDEKPKAAFQQQGTGTETRRIVRFLDTDIDGAMLVERGLRRINGVGPMFSNAVCLHTGIEPRRKMGSLSQEELKALGNALRNPPFPGWMLNRRKSIEGQDGQLYGTELQFAQREDINALRRMRAYRGIRHEMGLPVRGQRTRSSFRTNKTIGVTKKKQEPARAAGPAAAKPAAPAKK